MNQFFVYIPRDKFAEFQEFVNKASEKSSPSGKPDDQYGWYSVSIFDEYLLEFKILYGEWANEV